MRAPLSHSDASFDFLYEEYPGGGPRSYDEYRKEIQDYRGIPLPFSPNPHATYEEDYAYEVAYDRYLDEIEQSPEYVPRSTGRHGWVPTAGRDELEPDFEAG
jgi:hypothetical protein